MDKYVRKGPQEVVGFTALVLQMLLIRKNSLEKHTHLFYYLCEDLPLT